MRRLRRQLNPVDIGVLWLSTTLNSGMFAVSTDADTSFARMGHANAAMQIGDLVIYDGAVYVLRGLDPMSVPERRAELEDPATGERVRVPLSEVEDAPAEPEV